jgi:hypothetical protein
MKNSKLVEEAKLNPGRIYHRPHDVLRDRRLDDAARLEILRAWEEDIRTDEPAGQNGDAIVRFEDVEIVLREIEQRLPQAPAAGS